MVSHTQHIGDAVQELADHGATCVLLNVHGEMPTDAMARWPRVAGHAIVVVVRQR